RLVGRLAWLMAQLDSKPTVSKRKAKRGRKPSRPRRGVEVSDPWAVPEEDDPPPETASAGYRVVEHSFEEDARPAAPSDLDNPDPYAVSGTPDPPATAAPARLALEEHRVQREI